MTFSESALAALMRHDWPGNVRELRGVVEAAANLAEDGRILETHLGGLAAPSLDGVEGEPDIVPLAEVERRHIVFTYRKLAHNKTHTAKSLGISIPTLVRKLRAYGLD